LQFRNYIKHLTFATYKRVSKSNSRGHKLLTEARAAGLKWLIDRVSQNYTSHQQHAKKNGKQYENSTHSPCKCSLKAIKHKHLINFSVQMKLSEHTNDEK
jgi:hypothetical protein